MGAWGWWRIGKKNSDDFFHEEETFSLFAKEMPDQVGHDDGCKRTGGRSPTQGCSRGYAPSVSEA